VVLGLPGVRGELHHHSIHVYGKTLMKNHLLSWISIVSPRDEGINSIPNFRAGGMKLGA